MPTHKILDAASEKAKGKKKIGSTLKGIGPTYMDKTGRNGLRAGNIHSPEFTQLYENLREKHFHLLGLYDYSFSLKEMEEEWMEAIEQIKKIRMVDGEYFVHDALHKGKKILAEGAQGSMLDIDFGTYPFVTSSNTITAGVCTGSGINPSQIGEVIGISKAYCTRVGSGPFPSEEDNETGALLRKIGHEYGATTGRERRCGWIDLVALKYAIMINGVTQLVITKVDVMNDFDEIKAAVAYEVDGVETDQVPFDLHHANVKPVYKTFKGWKAPLEGIESFEQLPPALKDYITFLEKELSVSVSMISSGPGRNELIPAKGKNLTFAQ
jgi:adenylosuccinate synthase